jgi:tRNA threonylcarbamoyladenosine biosynthesis protein TsaB
MLVLGIDTANSACAVALVRGSAILSRRREDGTRGQAERLLPMILECLGEAGAVPNQLDRIGVNVGPGAFTGLRVGLAAARGLALAAGRPLVGITAFEAVVHAHRADGDPEAVLAVLLESRRDDVYLQLFDSVHRPQGAPRSIAPGAIGAALAAAAGDRPVWLLGDAAARVRPHVGGRVRLAETGGEAEAIALLAAGVAAGDLARHPADPLYIRAPDVTPAAAVAAP